MVRKEITPVKFKEASQSVSNLEKLDDASPVFKANLSLLRDVMERSSEVNKNFVDKTPKMIKLEDTCLPPIDRSMSLKKTRDKFKNLAKRQ
jgi:hypothetical protein